MKRSFLIILFVLLLSSGIWAAITLDVGSAFSSGTNATVHTFTNFTVANSTTGLLLDGMCSNTSEFSTTSIRFNGDDLTEGRAISSAEFATAELWYRLAPDVATGSLETTLNTSAIVVQTGISLIGVNQSTPIRGNNAASGTTETSSSFSLTTVAGDWVVSCVMVRNAPGDPGALVPTDGTEIEETFVNTNLRGSCLYKTATGTSTSVGWSWTTATGWAHVALAVEPASTAAGSPIMLISRRRH